MDFFWILKLFLFQNGVSIPQSEQSAIIFVAFCKTVQRMYQ